MKSCAVITWLVASSVCYSNTDNTIEIVKKNVDQFCTAEFDGKYKKERLEYMTLSAKEWERRERARNGDPVRVDLVDFRTDPVDIAGSFKILKVAVNGSDAVATIEYSMLGMLRYPPKAKLLDAIRVTKSKTNCVVVDLKMKWDASRGRWLVVDPPIPKVSKAAILAIQNAELEEFSRILRTASSPLPHLEALVKKYRNKIKAINDL